MAKLLLITIIGSLAIINVQAGPVPEEFKEVAPTIRETCMKETGVVEELINNANDGQLVEDKALKCYLKCIFDQFRLVNTKNGINFDVFLKLAPPSFKEIAEKIVVDCRDIKAETEGDMCDLVFQVNKCMLKIAGDRYFVM